jgi:hypothetical protein
MWHGTSLCSLIGWVCAERSASSISFGTWGKTQILSEELEGLQIGSATKKMVEISGTPSGHLYISRLKHLDQETPRTDVRGQYIEIRIFGACQRV